jgi:hypothetical protein
MQIYGVNITFDKISCGYGIFSSGHTCQSFENTYVDDWGYTEYSIKNSQIRKYFKY